MKVWMRLVYFNYNFECDWVIYQSDDKLSVNNLASEFVENVIFNQNRQQTKYGN